MTNERTIWKFESCLFIVIIKKQVQDTYYCVGYKPGHSNRSSVLPVEVQVALTGILSSNLWIEIKMLVDLHNKKKSHPPAS
jgi:hypothetical protein